MASESFEFAIVRMMFDGKVHEGYWHILGKEDSGKSLPEEATFISGHVEQTVADLGRLGFSLVTVREHLAPEFNGRIDEWVMQRRSSALK